MKGFVAAAVFGMVMASIAIPAQAKIYHYYGTGIMTITPRHHVRHRDRHRQIEDSQCCVHGGSCLIGKCWPNAPITSSPHSIQNIPVLRVVASAAEKFRGLVADLIAEGYNVGLPGCLSSGHMAHSKHHWGGACDLFNQVSRNHTALRQPPPNVQIALAERHGLTSGCIWRSPDCGHFEVPTGGTRTATRRHRHYDKWALLS